MGTIYRFLWKYVTTLPDILPLYPRKMYFMFNRVSKKIAGCSFAERQGLVYSRLFFDRFQKTQGRKNSRLKKTQGCFSAKNSTFRRFLRLQPKNSKEKIVHRKLFIWVDALNVIFMDMVVDFFQCIRTFVCFLVLFRAQIRVCKKHKVNCCEKPQELCQKTQGLTKTQCFGS